jgi:two-component system, OmpR family, sensor histidine kinase KdpD
VGDERSRRGRLRVYLGAAPGSGKTFAMLREGRERVAQGEDVVVGFVETYGRPRTVEAVGRLEVLPRLRVPYHGTVLEEMDVEAVLARRPQVALVDELAHTNAPGLRNAKRWQDVEELRDAGIEVVTTLNIQHIESVKDLAEHITGMPVGETVPDQVIDGADEVHLIDIAPEALRKRMRHGNIYAPDKIDTALRNFFRPGNLAALREIALRHVADSTAGARGEVRPPPQDVLVLISGGPDSEALIRRGARIARRLGGWCSVLMVLRSRDGPDPSSERWRALARQLHCSFIEQRASDLGRTAVAVARELGVRHVVLGESRARALGERWRRSLVDRLVDDLPGTDIHVIGRVPTRRSRPTVEVLRRRPDDVLLETGPRRRRGALRVYIGYARGVGTTTAMLEEARRRRGRGTDAVVAATTPGRPGGESALAGLELLGGPNGPAAHDRLDLDALLRRNPEVACIDDLAGLDVTGRTRAEVVGPILDAGINVIATLHTSDLRATVEAISPSVGELPIRPRLDETVLDLADELELVDVTPSVLEDRLRRGVIVTPAEVTATMPERLRAQLLAVLREATYRLIAEHTDRQLVAYMRERHIERPWEARPRVMVAVPPRAGMEDLIRRAARLAAVADGELHAVTVRTARLSESEESCLREYARLVGELGGDLVTLEGSSTAAALTAHARHILATEVLLARGRHGGRWHRGTLQDLIGALTDVDIHVIATEPVPSPPSPGPGRTS